MSNLTRRLGLATLCAVAAALISGCGGGDDAPPPAPAPTTFKISGSVAGLASGASVVLANGTSQVTVTAAGNFEFPAATTGTAYAVSVATQPTGQFCNIVRAAGTVASAVVDNIRVACAVVLAGGTGELTADGGTVTTAAVDITAPASASLQAQTITVSAIAPPAGLPATVTAIGAAQDVSVSQPDALNAPLLLTIRYDASIVASEDDLAVVHFDRSTNRYEAVTVLEHDKTAHAFKIEARSFSPFVVVALVDQAIPSSYSVPNYSPVANGWNIPNFGNYYTPGGNCLGMSAYANWYFGSRSDGLNTKFSATGDPSIAQLVAVRAHLAQSQYWAQKSSSYLSRLSNATTARLMRLYLAILGRPMILLLGVDGSPRHASVLYGYDSTGFRFYDVNVPGTAQTVGFDGSNWGTYGGYNSFTFVALPSLGRTEDFAQLTTEAEGGFTSSNLITLTSPTPDQQIATRSVSLTGTLSSTLATGASMVAYVSGVPQQVAASTGSFSATLPVSTGVNTVVLLAGVNIGQQSNWYRNAATRIISVTGTSPRTTLLTTLTWDQDNADVDLYVTEPAPSGQTSWYANKLTGNRLELDFDNTSGFGPEHTTLTTLGTTPGTVLPGQYRIRVHYYSGQNQTATGSVSILVNEGQPNQQLVTRRFTITGPSSGNDAPTDTGGNWADIATVDLVNGVVNLNP
jgi:uncharacterized protein YfaP (DUF2135 family)